MWRRLIFPLVFTVAIIGAIELGVQLCFHPSFWQKSTWLLHDPYRGREAFERMVLYEKLTRFESYDPDIISVGDSSGFFGIQSRIVNRYIGDHRYLSYNIGANHVFAGVKAIAEYELQRHKHIKYVVLYVYPHLLPTEEILRLGDLAPVVADTLTGLSSYVTPPSAYLSPYLKNYAFMAQDFTFGDEMLNNDAASQQLGATADDALGWLPEFDVRLDRINGRSPFFSDQRNAWSARLGFGEQSSIYATLDDFNRMIKNYGARLAIAFAPMPARAVTPGDPYIAAAEAALSRFSYDNPDVKFLLPLITRWSPEKFGTANHVSREYSFLSSMRLGKAIARLLADPGSIPPYTPQFHPDGPLPSISAKIAGPADPELLKSALAFFLYASTMDESHRALISRRVLDLLDHDQAYQFGLADARVRHDHLSARQIRLDVDLSQLRARPIEVSGMSSCDDRPDTQWVQVDGVPIFTFKSPTRFAQSPVNWPETSNIFIPTIVEDGVRKFDGYCPEPSLSQ